MNHFVLKNSKKYLFDRGVQEARRGEATFSFCFVIIEIGCSNLNALLISLYAKISILIKDFFLKIYFARGVPGRHKAFTKYVNLE